MRKTIIAASLASAAFAVPQFASAQTAAAPAAAPASPHTFTGNMSLVTDYRFRGISQTFKQPALQGGVRLLARERRVPGQLELQRQRGRGLSLGQPRDGLLRWLEEDLGRLGPGPGPDLLLLPGHGREHGQRHGAGEPAQTAATHTGKISNTEVYIGGSWKWISLKYSHAVSDYFSQPDTDGSNYWDLSANYDLGDGWNLLGHLGMFNLRKWDVGTDATKASYTDWKIGVTKDLSGWVVGASYIDTTGKGSCNVSNPGYYCFGNNAPFASSTKTKDASGGTVVFSVSKSF